jgi:hypothetical protein
VILSLKILIWIIAGIRNRNWIYIWRKRKLDSLPNANEFKGAAMKVATTTNTTSPRQTSESAFRRLLRTLRAELRRGVQLTCEKYQHGMLPPL